MVLVLLGLIFADWARSLP